MFSEDFIRRLGSPVCKRTGTDDSNPLPFPEAFPFTGSKILESGIPPTRSLGITARIPYYIRTSGIIHGGEHHVLQLDFIFRN